MPGSTSPRPGEGSPPYPSRAARLAAALPLPARSDWRAQDGWLPAGLLLLATGAAAVVLLAWRRMAPATAPAAAPLLAAIALLGLLGLVAGGAVALRPGGQAPTWRWLTLGAVALGALLADPRGLHGRFGWPYLVTAGLLALGLRAGEALAAALALPLQERARLDPLAGPAAVSPWAPQPPPRLEVDAASGQSPIWTAWRLVAEFWVLAALTGAASALPASPAWRLAAAAAGAGGALLAVGAALTTLQASWTARGFIFDRGQASAFWGMGMAVAAALIVLALALPTPPAPFSAGVLSAALRGLGAVHAPFAAVRAGSATRAGGVASPLGLLILPAAVVAWLAREFWLSLGLWLLGPLALPVILPVAVAAGFFLLRALRRPAFRAWGAHLLRTVLAALAFWRPWRLPRRMRRLLQAMGLLRPGPGGAGAPAAEPTPLERLWDLVDPRAAVRRTYRRFLRAMAEAGAVRGAGQSPRAFEATLLARQMAGPGVGDLTEAYELARFSGRPAERTWARRARRGWATVAGKLGGTDARQHMNGRRRRPL